MSNLFNGVVFPSSSFVSFLSHVVLDHRRLEEPVRVQFLLMRMIMVWIFSQNGCLRHPFCSSCVQEAKIALHIQAVLAAFFAQAEGVVESVRTFLLLHHRIHHYPPLLLRLLLVLPLPDFTPCEEESEAEVEDELEELDVVHHRGEELLLAEATLQHVRRILAKNRFFVHFLLNLVGASSARIVPIHMMCLGK